MQQMDPAVMQKLVELLSQNEQQDQMDRTTDNVDQLRAGPHHSFLGGLLGGVAGGTGGVMQNEQRGKRKSLMEEILKALQGEQQPQQMGAAGDFPSPLGGASYT